MTQPGQNYNVTRAIEAGFSHFMGQLNICLPGIVLSYTSDTRRAEVMPAIQIVVPGQGYEDRVPIVNVPVIFPTGGDYALTVPVQPQDVVLLMFSQQGIANFKRTFTNAPPTRIGFFSLQDAIAIAGLGPIMVTPALSDGIALQSVDGSAYVGLDSGGAKIVSSNISLTGSVNVSGSLRVNGRTI